MRTRPVALPSRLLMGLCAAGLWVLLGCTLIPATTPAPQPTITLSTDEPPGLLTLDAADLRTQVIGTVMAAGSATPDLPTFIVTPTLPPTRFATVAPSRTPTLTPTRTLTPTAPPTPTDSPTETPPPPLQMPYPDASRLLGGLCFQFLQTLTGETLVLDSGEALTALYQRADESKRCRDVAKRQAYALEGRELVGTVIGGRGCGLVVRYLRTERDDNARTRRIIFGVTVAGDCPYELVQPLMLALERLPDYRTTIQIER